MSFTLVIILSFAITIPALLGLIRYRAIDPVYQPFLWCLWIGLLNEIISVLLLWYRKPTVININLYYLIEALLFLLLFKNLGSFRRKQMVFFILLGAMVVGWLSETLLLSHMIGFNSYFLIGYAATLCILSVVMISELLVRVRTNLLKNSEFIICVAFLVYYTFEILSEIFWMYGLGENKQFRMNVEWISVFTNLFANLLYTIAIAWMPIKRKFSLPSL
ncbi:MAG TPA: hypothetical protein VKH37_07355 [Ferruginibacter sp.]|nr:hypothetical protein [Ferruginibacter sp.]